MKKINRLWRVNLRRILLPFIFVLILTFQTLNMEWYAGVENMKSMATDPSDRVIEKGKATIKVEKFIGTELLITLIIAQIQDFQPNMKNFAYFMVLTESFRCMRAKPGC